MKAERITPILIALCAFMAAAVGGVASMPVAAPSGPVGVADNLAATDTSGVATGGLPAASGSATNDSAGQVSDCDLIDIDGNDNTVSTNITSNTSGHEDSNVSVQLRCEVGNTPTLDNDLIDIDGDNNSVTLTVRAENGMLLLGSGSGVENNVTGLDITSQCKGGTLADCDVVDIDGENNSVKIVVQSNGGQTVYEFGTDSASSPNQSDAHRSTQRNASYYQVDLVTGAPIQNLRGPAGYYTPDRLIRFAHGSTDVPVMRRSDGEFTTNQSVAGRIDSQNITVANGTATTTFTVANGSEPVTLTLASYRKIGPGWSPRTEAQQQFVDSDTETFDSGTYSLIVDIPDGKANVSG